MLQPLLPFHRRLTPLVKVAKVKGVQVGPENSTQTRKRLNHYFGQHKRNVCCTTCLLPICSTKVDIPHPVTKKQKETVTYMLCLFSQVQPEQSHWATGHCISTQEHLCSHGSQQRQNHMSYACLPAWWIIDVSIHGNQRGLHKQFDHVHLFDPITE